ncbi:hypothetical protein ACQKOH_12685 [Sphingomonas sp. NPDC092331]|jgi:hypothetical protein|nr:MULTISPECIES: hypothetical protein [unclassified Sphingomonas]MBQ1500764.1 hypothetical protein [Sphingomonas sp.]MDH4744674.1 hypothetical protein [Sphingomonas sp. CBMAI 2297]
MVRSEVRTYRVMWFLAGAVTMAMYLLGPHAIARNAYDAADRVSLWVASL